MSASPTGGQGRASHRAHEGQFSSTSTHLQAWRRCAQSRAIPRDREITSSSNQGGGGALFLQSCTASDHNGPRSRRARALTVQARGQAARAPVLSAPYARASTCLLTRSLSTVRVAGPTGLWARTLSLVQIGSNRFWLAFGCVDTELVQICSATERRADRSGSVCVDTIYR